MARLNISMPDDLCREAKRGGLNIPRLSQAAVADELNRRAKVAGLDAYLAELEAELGPISAAELTEAERWADRVRSDVRQG